MKHTMHAVAAGLMLMLSGCGSDNDENTQVIAIDVLAANIEGQFSLNGGDFPVSQYEHGIISMADTDGNPAMLSETYNGEYAVMLVQGDYTDHYSVVQSGGNVPVNKGETISGNHSVQIDQVHDVEVTAPSVRFQFTLNSMPFPATEYDDGNFYLQSQTGGEAFLLGNSHSSIDPVQVMPGTYDVIYELESGGDQVPVNQHATVDTMVIDEMTSGVTVDSITVDFRLSATLDGSPFPVSQYEHGIFRLVDSSGDIVELGEIYNLPLAVKVIEGSYDITYSHVDGLALPVNDEAIILANVDISVNSAPVIDILSAEVTPS